jgi:outer membrane lipoprotein-sorting protein
MSQRLSLALAALVLSLAGPARASDQAEIERLLNLTDDMARGESSTATIVMQVKTARYERSVKMNAWTKGTEKSLIRIVEPAKEAGTSTLKVGDNIWNYLPKVDKTIKVPSSMMSGSWMGSHFTNDDLVKENRLSEEFTATLTARAATAPDGLTVIELVPKPDAPVVWGKVIVRLTKDEVPKDIRYYDEKGTLVRTMEFSDVRTFDGRRIPAVATVVPADKPGEYTKVIYEQLDFDASIGDETFTLQALKQ